MKTRAFALGSILTFMFVAATSVSAQFLGSTGKRGATLISVDPSTGAGTAIAPTGTFGPVTEIEFRDDGVLFGTIGGGDGGVITIDPLTGAEALVGTHQFGAVNALEFMGSVLYGAYTPFAGQESQLVTVDPTNGQLTFIGATGVSNIGGLAVDVRTNVMYGAESSDVGGGHLLTIDLTTGAATVVGPTGFADLAALEFGPAGILYGGTGGSGSTAGHLITIDVGTGAATLVGPTGFPALSGLTCDPTACVIPEPSGVVLLLLGTAAALALRPRPR